MRKKRAHDKPACKSFIVPVYTAVVFVVVAKNIVKARNTRRWNDKFGIVEGEFVALCSRNDVGQFGLFFTPNQQLEEVSHEVFHLTHRILEHHGAPLTPVSHEHAALLHGYLMGKIGKMVMR